MERTRALSEYVAHAADARLDDVTTELGRLHLLDTLAAIVACRNLDAAVVGRRFARLRSGGGSGGGAGEATVLGTDDRAPLVDAVFASAMTAHAAEINDFIPSVFVQPGPAIVSSALGVGEVTGASGDQVLAAMVAGYELAARMPRALGVGNLRRAGIANHGVGPCFGAAATAAALFKLAPERVGDVLSVVAQQASGSWQWLLDVEHIEKAFVFAGLGARNGVDAVLLVQAGYRGVPDVLDRSGTWFTAAPFTSAEGDGDLDALTRDLGASVLPDVAYKRYPVGGPTQPAVEALLDMTDELDAADVDRVVIEMPGRYEAFRDAAMPALNLRYLAAIILLDGELDFVSAQSLSRMHDDPAVRAVMGRVEVRHDRDQEAGPGEPRTESARVTVVLREGESLTRFVPHVLGFPSHPMSPSDVESKAGALMAPHLGDDAAARVIEATRDLASVTAADLVALIARPGEET